MKRSLVFSAELLSYLEGVSDPLGAAGYDLFNYFEDQLSVQGESEQNALRDNLGYHIDLLEGAGLIMSGTQDCDDSIYYTLTWAGHDYLDNHRAASVK